MEHTTFPSLFYRGRTEKEGKLRRSDKNHATCYKAKIFAYQIHVTHSPKLCDSIKVSNNKKVSCHILEFLFDIKWHTGHQKYDMSQFGRSWCLKKHLNLCNPFGVWLHKCFSLFVCLNFPVQLNDNVVPVWT